LLGKLGKSLSMSSPFGVFWITMKALRASAEKTTATASFLLSVFSPMRVMRLTLDLCTLFLLPSPGQKSRSLRVSSSAGSSVSAARRRMEMAIAIEVPTSLNSGTLATAMTM